MLNSTEFKLQLAEFSNPIFYEDGDIMICISGLSKSIDFVSEFIEKNSNFVREGETLTFPNKEGNELRIE